MGKNSIFTISESGLLDELVTFINSGGNINERSHDGHTALHYAAKAGQSCIVKVLIAHGADPRAQTLKGNTPLHGAAYKGHTGTVLTLLKAGADKSTKNSDGETALDRAIQHNQIPVIEALK